MCRGARAGAANQRRREQRHPDETTRAQTHEKARGLPEAANGLDAKSGVLEQRVEGGLRVEPAMVRIAEVPDDAIPRRRNPAENADLEAHPAPWSEEIAHEAKRTPRIGKVR